MCILTSSAPVPKSRRSSRDYRPRPALQVPDHRLCALTPSAAIADPGAGPHPAAQAGLTLARRADPLLRGLCPSMPTISPMAWHRHKLIWTIWLNPPQRRAGRRQDQGSGDAQRRHHGGHGSPAFLGMCHGMAHTIGAPATWPTAVAQLHPPAVYVIRYNGSIPEERPAGRSNKYIARNATGKSPEPWYQSGKTPPKVSRSPEAKAVEDRQRQMLAGEQELPECRTRITSGPFSMIGMRACRRPACAPGEPGAYPADRWRRTSPSPLLTASARRRPQAARPCRARPPREEACRV